MRKSEYKMDEALESMWISHEKEKYPVSPNDIGEGIIEKLGERGLVHLKDNRVFFTEKGEKKARNIIRRHRLAERLMIDVLEMGEEEIESPACKFEHILSEGVGNAICTLLGHPRLCPHGLPIPEGECCRKTKKAVESIVVPLTELAVGETGTVTYILTKSNPRLHRLLSLGITPGLKIRVHQKSPSYVIQAGETQVALENEIIESIYVRRIR